MDVTSKSSIAEGVKALETKEGRVDILVNKYVLDIYILLNCFNVYLSAGVFSKITRREWPSDESKITPELIAEWAKELYDAYDFKDWEQVCQTNVSAIFFVTLAFLPLLVRGTQTGDGLASSVINIASIWGHSKLNYGTVRSKIL